MANIDDNHNGDDDGEDDSDGDDDDASYAEGPLRQSRWRAVYEQLLPTPTMRQRRLRSQLWVKCSLW